MDWNAVYAIGLTVGGGSTFLMRHFWSKPGGRPYAIAVLLLAAAVTAILLGAGEEFGDAYGGFGGVW